MRICALSLSLAFSALSALNAVAVIRYVNVNSASPTPPFTNWNTAAVTIQDAVDAAANGDEILVTNGLYQIGGRAAFGVLTNRVAVTKPLTLRSVNGPSATIIEGNSIIGDHAVRCIYLTNGAALIGFTLTGGATRDGGDVEREQNGGGVWCESVGALLSNCVLVANSANNFGGGAVNGTLIGCTVTNNYAPQGGGAFGGVLNNSLIISNTANGAGGGLSNIFNSCTLIGNFANGAGGGAAGGTLSNCTLIGNVTIFDNTGGAFQCALANCTLNGNSYGAAYQSIATNCVFTSNVFGAAVDSTLNNCVLSNNLNWAAAVNCFSTNCTFTGNQGSEGGGAYGGVLDHCTLSGNVSLHNSDYTENGGGASGALLVNCKLTENRASRGGGAGNSTLVNCALYGNISTGAGGGADSCSLVNCTVVGNSAVRGGGLSSSSATNCIVYHNFGDNYYFSDIQFSCTTPIPPAGFGNITADPHLADFSHISIASPGRGAGNAAVTSGKDVDGEAWVNPPSIGCDEFRSGSITGALSVAVSASYTNVATGFSVNFTAQINGHASSNRWNFGDGAIANNLPFASHSFAFPGDYPVTFTAYNESFPAGVSAAVTIHVVAQPIHYVNQDSAGPLAPFGSWATAATNIQDAIDAAAVPGALVLVTNGVYQSGGRVIFYQVTNRIAVTKPITVQSANGAAATTIRAGTAHSRCAYLTNGVALSGFTLTSANASTDFEGTTEDDVGGGVYCASALETISDCIVVSNYARANGGGIYGGTVSNCSVQGNQASYGGGGVESATLNNCRVSSNTASFYGYANGGGANNSTLNNCTIAGNYADNGGGVANSVLRSCVIADNSAASAGGVAGSLLNNCAVMRNFSSGDAGGAYNSALNNCTLTGNSAAHFGGGADACTLNNCITYYNTALEAANCLDCTNNFSCTTPLPLFGSNNITAEPELADAFHLSTNSPCRSAGSSLFAVGTDIDGELWMNPPSMGCDEFHSGSITGLLSVAASVDYTNVSTGFTLHFNGLISGHASASRWEFGDGTIVSNNSYATHAFNIGGDFTVVLRAYNESNPAGVSATVMVHVVSNATHYVSLTSANPAAPYLSWATAATNIQDAADVGYAGSTVLVSNGAYSFSGRIVYAAMSNRVAVLRPITLRSVNGPGVTTIQGFPASNSNAVRCAYLTNNSALIGFTLTGGGTHNYGDLHEQAGGGVFCEYTNALVSNCVFRANTALYGGAAFGGTLRDCTIVSNSAQFGGGAYSATLDRCALVGNFSLIYGGGANNCTLHNCGLTNNTANSLGGGAIDSGLSNCALSANHANNGGGTYACGLTNCTLTANDAGTGGGAREGTLDNCRLINNSAGNGGGAYNATLVNCLLSGNSASLGGGAFQGTLNNCVVSGNLATSDSGGAHNAMLNNCAVFANHSDYDSGGGHYCTWNNCTITGNSAIQHGGGANEGTLLNCIVFYNTAEFGNNWFNASLNSCCTTPLPDFGTDNINAEPLLADALHLSAASPCRSSGNSTATTGADIDGEAWANPPSIGCDEYRAGNIVGGLSVAIQASHTNAVSGSRVSFTAQINGRASASRWNFGDGTIISNRPYVSHAWTSAGDYVVTLTAYNESNPAGINAALMIHVVTQAIYYVSLASATPLPPFSSWPTAATNIQGAVDAASATAGSLVLASNGVYATGARVAGRGVTNRVAVISPMMLRSVNGPAVTAIDGGGAFRCVYLTNGIALSGFTLTNGHAVGPGGGVFSESSSATVSNCVLAGNSSTEAGGGAFQGTINNCTLIKNSAPYGGGVHDCTVRNSTFLTNSATSWGGGARASTLYNCTLNGGTSSRGGGGSQCSFFNCTLNGNSSGDVGGAGYLCGFSNCVINGGTSDLGGAAYGSSFDNCTLTGNSARYGGAGSACTFNNCKLTFNHAAGAGGAAHGCSLNNCTIVSNSCSAIDGEGGGGTVISDLRNCVNYYNTAPAPFPPDSYGDVLTYCCTPSPGGTGNFTNAPLFVNLAAGNLRLQSSSPCINSGKNSYAPATLPDLDGNSRISGGTVDVGAYEFQTPASLISYAWLQNYGLPTNGSADFADADGDLFNNWQEWRAGTDPTNASSLLKLLTPMNTGTNVVLRWQSVDTRAYFLERATNLGAPTAFQVLNSNIVGEAGITSYADTNTVSAARFYRVGVQE